MALLRSDEDGRDTVLRAHTDPQLVSGLQTLLRPDRNFATLAIWKANEERQARSAGGADVGHGVHVRPGADEDPEAVRIALLRCNVCRRDPALQ
eukprot:1009574-Rhodomonas_salina.2